ncbi:MAG TPA: hypothetical protein VFZ17_03885, partial [Acidimicrobiia bacterium]|nr:hypothetical protein [Acidimicrobiia bacterium]
ADAQAATAGASSVRISGSVDENGNRTSLNVVAAHGEGGGVLFQQGKRFQIIVHTPDLYMKAPASTWTALNTGDDTAAGEIAAQLFAGRWVRMSTTNDEFGGMANLFEISTFVSETGDLSSVTKRPVTTFHGARAIPLYDSVKQSTVYVAATGAPYVLGMTSNGASTGSVVFSQYGSAKVPPAPAHSVDLSALEQAPA